MLSYCLIAPSDYDYSNTHIRYKTEFHDSFFGDKDFKICLDGIPFYTINTYYKAEGDKRGPTMYYQAGVLVLLNPQINKDALAECLSQINLFQCVPILPLWQINDILNEQYEKMQDGVLDMKAGVKKIVYKTNASMTLKDKRKLHGSISGQQRIQNTLSRIDDAISTLMAKGCKIVQTQIEKESGRSLRTIKSHWSRYKEMLSSYNSSLLLKEGAALEKR